MRNAFSGYTYQKQVTLLLLSLMDVERNISKIDIEVKADNNFDDLVVTTKSESFQFQIKDFESVSLDDLQIKGTQIFIKGNSHTLSRSRNIIFFKEINIEPNEKILNFSSYKFDDKVSLISLSRIQIDEVIDDLYKNNEQRRNEIESFFNSILDKRVWHISIESLPQLKIFITELQEKSVLISHNFLKFNNLLLIEGKPGVGKSHFVNTLVKDYKKNIVYRFWICNQDKDYHDRLRYDNFIRDLNTKLFIDLKIREIEELLNKLKEESKTFIIDGFDHVENYNNTDFNNFIDFINRAKDYCKIIVLSRPLINEPNWKKHTLENWNLQQTEKVLKALFYLERYSIVDEIYQISQGYPIVVKYLAEHFKIHKAFPKIEQIHDIDSYYQSIINNEKGKHSLSLFLCCSSYVMKSEIELFIGDEKYYVEEFINEHPYLFDIKLNRISLLHDSFNTFLRKKVEFKSKVEKVSEMVSESILSFERRFLSRFSFFQFSKEQKKKILIKYSSIKAFENVLENNIDFESVRAFYNQLRETLLEFSSNTLTVSSYYDLSLIFNLIVREHLSTINTFYYTYVQSLIANGITDEDITSSDYLFGMYYYIRAKNASVLLNRTANDHYETEHFYKRLENDVYKEHLHIQKHSKKLTRTIVEKALKDSVNFQKNITHIIENIFIHELDIKGYEDLKFSFEKYLVGEIHEAVYILKTFIIKYNVPDYYANWILKNAFDNLLTYGYKIDKGKNEYQDLTLKELICKYSSSRSFELGEKIHSYIRLALLENRKIDIRSIYLYWTKYYQRKDYTLFGLPVALKTLHSANIISLKEAIQFIINVQEMSEKGIRHLLAEFIELYNPFKIISFLENNFDVKELQVQWFKLSPKYINDFSDSTYNFAENRLLNIIEATQFRWKK